MIDIYIKDGLGENETPGGKEEGAGAGPDVYARSSETMHMEPVLEGSQVTIYCNSTMSWHFL